MQQQPFDDLYTLTDEHVLSSTPIYNWIIVLKHSFTACSPVADGN